MSSSIDHLDFHTTEFTPDQLENVVGQILERVAEDYPERRINLDRLRRGIYAAHQAKPIRLIALLHSCAFDFPTDVIMGIYRHYDPKTDSMKDGWTAQHAEPHTPSIWDILFGGDDDEEEDADEYKDYHSSY